MQLLNLCSCYPAMKRAGNHSAENIGLLAVSNMSQGEARDEINFANLQVPIAT